MEKGLKFLSTISVDEFKKQQQVDKIEVLRNENTGKCFFVYGSMKGACSAKANNEQMTEPMISEVCSADTGDVFYLLHQKSEGATTLAVL